MDAALPFYLENFFFGLVCYLAFRSLKSVKIKADTVFPMVAILSLAIFKWSGKEMGLLPFLVWASLFALLVEPESSFSSRYVTPIFTNRISLWLGKISFSIYLSHALVMDVVQRSLFVEFPHATQMQHFWLLGSLTFGITILLSAVLYYGIEAPFIKFGKELTLKRLEAAPQIS